MTGHPHPRSPHQRPDLAPKTGSVELDAAFVTAIQQACGRDGVELVRFLAARGPTSNVELLEAHPHHNSASLHRALYALFQMRAATYRATTDTRGWITFTWYITGDGLWKSLRRRAASQLQAARSRLQLERSTDFFQCANGHRRLSFADAMARRFECPSCRGRMEASAGDRVQGLLAERIRMLTARTESLLRPWATTTDAWEDLPGPEAYHSPQVGPAAIVA